MKFSELKEKLNFTQIRGTNNGWLAKIDETKVCKILHLQNQSISSRKIKNLFDYLHKENNSSIVQIHEYGFDKRKEYFFYSMEKLNKISWRNSTIADQIIKEFCVLHRTKSIPKIFEERYFNFIFNIRKLKYLYRDIHNDNVMIDLMGNYKLIDLESFL
jgi:serine/threonine protein kinase